MTATKAVMTWRLSFLLCLLLVPSLSFSQGEQSDEICLRYSCFEKVLTLGSFQKPLRLIGAARYRFWGFSVYSVALYQPEGLTKNWHEKPLALVLSYYRTLEPEDFLKSSRKLLAKNPAYAAKGDESALLRFSSFITKVDEGDRYTLLFTPEDGALELFFNGTSRGKIIDRDFGIAYLGMWIGDYAVKEDQRDTILSGQFDG